MGSLRVGKVNYNPSDKPQDAPVYKSTEQRKKWLQIFGANTNYSDAQVANLPAIIAGNFAAKGLDSGSATH